MMTRIATTTICNPSLIISLQAKEGVPQVEEEAEGESDERTNKLMHQKGNISSITSPQVKGKVSQVWEST